MENTITLISGQKIDILMQDEVSLDIDCSLRYIESGKQELENYVEDVSKNRLNIVVEEAKAEMKRQIDNGILEAQEKASVSAKETIDENIYSMKSEIDSYIINEVKPDIEQNKNDAYQSAQIASQAASTATEVYNNLSASLELAKEVACGNIGDIKYTLRTSAPHGAVFCNGQILSEEQYPDLYQMILENRLNKVSIEEYENQVLTTGNCEFFAIDEEQKTIKVPTILQTDNSEGNAYVVCYTGKDTEIDITQEITLNNPFSLLDYKWSEYEITNASWLLSNGIFHSGLVYNSVYELLLKIKNGIETKAGVSVKLSTEEYSDTDFVINTADTTFRLPIKVKLASGKAVVGNGMTLGLTNGTNNGGLVGISSSGLGYGNNAYGVSIGSSTGNTGTKPSGAALGVTTDPTKSGIETSPQDLYLYFYVGETIQDANVIAAGGFLSALSNKVGFEDRETVVAWGLPDYSTAISLNGMDSYTATYPCWLLGAPLASAGTAQYVYVNGIIVTREAGDYNSMQIPLDVGDMVTVSASNLNDCVICAMKGIK